MLFRQGQRLRQRDCGWIGQPTLDVIKDHVAMVILNELTNQMPVQVNI
jgi:hypothetical protein